MSDVVSPLNLITGTGMILVGAFAVYYWYRKGKPKLEYFFFGAIFWGIAIGIKLLMDLTITAPINSYFVKNYPIIAALLIMSLYVGLRTGILESGIPYLAVKFTRLSKMSFNDAVAMGVGFGGSEAILLGLLSLLSVGSYVLFPGLLDLLPPESKALLLEQLTLKFIPLGIVERAFTLMCHVFAVVLAVYAVKLNDIKLLAVSIIYKTILDGMLPAFNHYIIPSGYGGYLIVEGFVAIMGILGYIGLVYFKGKYLKGDKDAYQA
jgi:uncharacterized membrane protein YhfC